MLDEGVVVRLGRVEMRATTWRRQRPPVAEQVHEVTRRATEGGDLRRLAGRGHVRQRS